MQNLATAKQTYVKADPGRSLNQKRALLKMVKGMYSYETLDKKKALALVYPEIDLKFLRWRDNKGWPRFAIFTPDRETCKLSVKQVYENKFDRYANFLGVRGCIHNNDTWKPRLVSKKLFADIFQKMEATCLRDRLKKLSIEQRFMGHRPPSVHAAETVAKESGLFSEIILICEAGPWDEERQAMPKGDPLIVGWIKDVQQTYLIDSFDITPIEETVRREFSEGKI